MNTSRLRADTNYFDVYGIKLLAGRSFTRNASRDTIGQIILNQIAVKKFGWKNPETAIGKPFKMGEQKGIVVGVTNNFNFNSLQHKLDQRHFTKKLVSLDIIWKLNERNTLKAKVIFSNSKITISGKANQRIFLRCNSLFISASSLPVCPLTLLFSCARRIRYGITSLRGPKGKYLLTEKPALARLNEI